MLSKILQMDADAAEGPLKTMGFINTSGALRNLKNLGAGPLLPELASIVAGASASASPDTALNNLEAIVKELAAGDVLPLLSEGSEALKRLITVCGASNLLSNTLSQNPEYLKWLFTGGLEETKNFQIFKEELLNVTNDTDDLDSVVKALRVYKQKEYLRIGGRDLLSLASLEEVTAELSDLAGASLDVGIHFAIKAAKKAHGVPHYTDADGSIKEAEFAVIGMGKLGGRELNFSSDIDIIYIYSSDNGETSGIPGKSVSKIGLHSFFTKVSTTLNRLIGSVTSDGFVFRIDLDLRPEGKGGDMANSLRSAEIYYESWGQSWERAAMIKARCVAGFSGLGEAFLAMIRPFVFRRYLDYAAIEEIKSMKERIDLSLIKRRPDAIDVKLGQGGIREIEFFCQTLQLINGGKDALVREANTIKAIDRLAGRGFLKEADAVGLKNGYRFLRTLEHRIQIADGRQSHVIPDGAEEIKRLARLLGFTETPQKQEGECFREEYEKVTAAVHDIYRGLFYKEHDGFKDIPEDVLMLLSPDITEGESLVRLHSLGFKDPSSAHKNLSFFKNPPSFVHINPRGRVLLQRLTPVFLTRSSASPDADLALSHLLRFISSVGARTTFYSLLAENPVVLDELIKLFGTSVFLSRSLIERPETLDLLLSEELSVPYKTKKDFSLFSNEITKLANYEDQLDTLRILKNRELFRIGINDIRGLLSPKAVSLQITFMAEACLEASYAAARAELIKIYGEPTEARFAIIGMGKLGGRELNYGSDLDIIFVYSAAGANNTARVARPAVTNGPKVISNHEFFIKLGQKIISMLTTKTREGSAFSVDTRLRPSGSSGPLVVSESSLMDYHSGLTGIWEAQAMTRARSVAGDVSFGSEVLTRLFEIIFSRGLKADDSREMLRIRGRMEVEIAKENPSRYNVKTGAGGIVDIEFLVQALQLKYGERKKLRTPFTQKALLRLYKEGLLPEADFKVLKEAYAFYKLIEMRLRIVHDSPVGYLYKDSEELATLARRIGYDGAQSAAGLLDKYACFAAKVRKIYLKVVGPE